MRPGEQIELYRKYPALAARDVLGLQLGEFQQILLHAAWHHPFFIMILTRGGGKTFLLSLFSTLRGMLYPGELIVITAPSFRQSKFVFREVEKLYRNSIFFQKVAPKGPKYNPDSCRIEFREDGMIEALPLGDGNKIRGKRAHTIIGDEAAHLPKAIFNTVVLGMQATSKNPMERVESKKQKKEFEKLGIDVEEEIDVNRILLSSTAYFKFNHLYERILKYMQIMNDETNPKRHLYDVRTFDHTMLPDGFMDEEAIGMHKGTMAKIQFDMEYMAKWVDDSEGWYKKIEDVRLRSVEIELACRNNAWYIIGIDPGLSVHSSITVLKILGQKVSVVNVISLENKPYPEIVKETRRVLAAYKNIKLVYMDHDGGGTVLRDLLAEEKDGKRYLDIDHEAHKHLTGKRIIKLIKCNVDWNFDANFALKAGIEHKRILFPFPPETYSAENTAMNETLDEGYEQIELAIMELRMIELTHTQRSGRAHFDTPQKSQRKDRFSSLLLAYKCFADLILNPTVQEEQEHEGELADIIVSSGGLIGPNDGTVDWGNGIVCPGMDGSRTNKGIIIQ